MPLIPNIQPAAEKEMAFRELEQRASEGDAEAAAILQRRSGQRKIVKRQVETGVPSELPELAQAFLGPYTPEAVKIIAKNRLFSLGGSLAGAKVAGPVGSTAGAMAGTALEQRLLKQKLDPKEMAEEGLVNLAFDIALPAVAKGGRELIRSSKRAQKFFEEVAQSKIMSTVDNFFRGVDPKRAGANLQEISNKGIKIKGLSVRKSFENTIPKNQMKKLHADIENIGLYPNENLVDIQTTNNKLKNATTVKPEGFSAPGIDDFDFGELQNLRSKIQKEAFAAQGAKKTKKFNRLMRAKDNIDKTIGRALVQPENVADRELYRRALDEYRLSKVHDSTAGIVADITKESKDRSSIEFSIGRFADILRNPSPKYKAMVSDIESVEGLKDVMVRELDALAATRPKLILDGFLANPVESLQAPGRAVRELYLASQVFDSIGSLFADVRGREYVRRIILEGDGRLTPKALTLGLQAIRRKEFQPIEGQNAQPGEPQ